MAPLHSLSDICRLSAALLVSATVEASLLTLALALALRLFPRISAVLRFALWIGVLLASVALPFLPLLRRSASAATPQTLLHADVRWSFAIAGLWALMSAARAAQLVYSMVRLRGIARRSAPVAESALNGGRPALLCTSDDVLQPSVIGFLTPRILIPTGLYSQLSTAELKQIVLHEREHLRRRDDWINLLQKIVLVLFPLNPALFWVERRLCLERELACDDSVLEATRTPKSYATCLVHLAENRIFGQQFPLALGAWGRKSELTRRVHHILEPARKRMSQPQAAMAVALIGSGLVGGAALLARTPQLVTFEPTAAASVIAAVRPALEAAPLREATGTNITAPHATLVKAVMPSMNPTPARRVRPVHRTPKPQQQRQWMLTTWTYQTQTVAKPVRISDSDTQRVTFSVIQSRQQVSSYAAFATANGWLIIQL